MFYDPTGLAMAAPPPPDDLMNMQSEYLQIQCILADGGERFGVSALAFDRYEELLWMGNQGGHVTSYYTGAMQKYTSFQIHTNEEVRQLLTINDGILGLTASSLRYQLRRGIPIFTHMSANMSEMQCMLQLSDSRMLMGGHHGKMIDFNLGLCKETKVIDVGESGCVMLRPHTRFVCAGNPLGRIDLRDPHTLNIEHTLDTHSGSLSDFDVQGNLLVTCGFSNRHGNLNVDRFLLVYDLRMMRAVTPIQTVLDPLYLRFFPTVTSRLAVVSALGHAQFLDSVAFAEPRLCLMHVDSPAMCLTFDISTTNQALAFGDSSGSIHLFASTPQPLFNSYSRMTEHADSVVSYHPAFAIDDYNTPLSVIPMPVNSPDVPLCSDWPEHFMKKSYRRPVGIDPEVLNTMRMKGPIGYAPNPHTTRRNQVQYDLDSHQTKTPVKQDGRTMKADENECFIAIPKRYRKVDVKYNKLGTDECQFDQFNRTGLTGLEATLPNSYCNAMIQVLYYIEPLRAILLSHLCNKEFCLSCELGFLFHMLKTSSNNFPCQPANFLRAFRTIPEASALSLLYSDLLPDQKAKMNLGALIQSWNRFIIHQLHVELAESKKSINEKKNTKAPFSYNVSDFPAIDGRERKKITSTEIEVNANLQQEKRDSESDIVQYLGCKQLLRHSCLKCKLEVKKESIVLVCNLIYPTNEPERDEWSFCDILARSLCSQQTTPAWCEQCKRFTPTSQIKMLQSLPKLLALNTGLHTPQHKQFWQSQMDKVVAKMTNFDVQPIQQQQLTPTSSPVAPSQHANSLNSSSKPCRYGDHCSRPGCRFRHSFDNAAPPAPLNNPYCSNNWLPHSISIELGDNKLIIENENKNVSSYQLDSSKESSETLVDGDESNSGGGGGVSEDSKDECKKLYDLTAVVCFVNDQSSNEKRNIVALINVPESYLGGENRNAEHRWFLFNDFSIAPVSAQEAVWFSLDWKVPCILYYSTREVAQTKPSISPPISKEVFTEDACIARSGGTSGITFTPLADNEFPKSGDLVAMDAEFVTLNQEEAELRSDGKMSMIKPSQMSVARITCIRGSGPMEGIPFIDDYISTQEQVVDYLTKFSGIKPGDLDANFSSKHLTTLKSTYTKLRFLQDSGVIFVGHGLKNDFRVINLVVPAEQVADTVHLFHLPHHRMVSLRFLAWHFLGVKIQSETHDSVEDARAALHLYKKYKQLEAQNKVGEALAELYEKGKMLSWKVPEDSS